MLTFVIVRRFPLYLSYLSTGISFKFKPNLTFYYVTKNCFARFVTVVDSLLHDHVVRMCKKSVT